MVEKFCLNASWKLYYGSSRNPLHNERSIAVSLFYIPYIYLKDKGQNLHVNYCVADSLCVFSTHSNHKTLKRITLPFVRGSLNESINELLKSLLSVSERRGQSFTHKIKRNTVDQLSCLGQLGTGRGAVMTWRGKIEARMWMMVWGLMQKGKGEEEDKWTQ